MANISVVLLAGGVSSRFSPLKEKNLYPFLGKTAVEIHLKRLSKLKPKKIILVVNAESKADFEKLVASLGAKNVDVVCQTDSGMAGGVLASALKINLDSELLIIGANDYYEDKLVEDFSKKRANLYKNNHAALAAYETFEYFPGGYLILKDNQIKGILEKPGPDNTPSNFVNMVFHYFPKGKILIDSLKSSQSTKDDLYEVSLDNLMKKGQIFDVIKYMGQWKSIKYPWHVLDVMDLFLSQIKDRSVSKTASISKSAVVTGNVIIEDGVKIFEGAVIKGPVYLGKNVIVGNNALVRDSIIGDGSVIGFSTEVARSYFKSNVWLHKNYVGDSVFENNVSFGSNTVTANLRLDEKHIRIMVKDQYLDTGRSKIGAIIGSNVRVGVSANIMPGVKIGSGSFIGPCVLLESDVEEKTFIKKGNVLKITKNKFEISIKSRENIKKALIKN